MHGNLRQCHQSWLDPQAQVRLIIITVLLTPQLQCYPIEWIPSLPCNGQHLLMDHQAVKDLKSNCLPSLKPSFAPHLQELHQVTDTPRLSSLHSDPLSQASACPQGHGSAVRVADIRAGAPDHPERQRSARAALDDCVQSPL